MRKGRRGSLLAGLMAGGGLLLAHMLDYVIAFRDPAYRVHVLARTGHGYLPSTAGLAITAAIVALLLSGLSGVRDRACSRPRVGWIFAMLTALQVGGFVVLELGERYAMGMPAHHLLSKVLPLGLVLQVLTAAASAILIRVVWNAGRAAARLVAGRRRTVRARSIIVSAGSSIARALRADVVRPSAPRSPPALVF